MAERSLWEHIKDLYGNSVGLETPPNFERAAMLPIGSTVNAPKGSAEYALTGDENLSDTKLALPSIISDALNALKKFRQGEVLTPEDSMALTSLVTTGGLASATWKVDPTRLGMFGGTKAAGGKLIPVNEEAGALKSFQDYTRAGSTQDEARAKVWEQSGLFIGPDGKARKFVSPDQAELTKDALNATPGGPEFRDVVGNIPLNRVLQNHPFEGFYPHTKVGVYLGADASKQTVLQEGLVSSKHRISISAEHMKDPEEFRNTLLHELQHVIQDVEGFGRGASTKGINALDVNFNDRISYIIQNSDADTILDTMRKLVPGNSSVIFASQKYKELIDRFNSMPEGTAKLDFFNERVIPLRSLLEREVGFATYKSALGEIESRAVERMSRAQGKSILPSEKSVEGTISNQSYPGHFMDRPLREAWWMAPDKGFPSMMSLHTQRGSTVSDILNIRMTKPR
jgi:hypothetical protein